MELHTESDRKSNMKETMQNRNFQQVQKKKKSESNKSQETEQHSQKFQQEIIEKNQNETIEETDQNIWERRRPKPDIPTQNDPFPH